jgi:hypothetical protein
MRFSCYSAIAQSLKFAAPTPALGVFPKHASSEGPVPHPGLLRVLGILGALANAKFVADARQHAAFT